MKYIIGLGIVLGLILIYAMSSSPEGRDVDETSAAAKASQKTSKVTVQPKSEAPVQPRAERKEQPPQPLVEEATPPSTQVEQPEEPPKETGPFEVSFGQHTIHFAQDRGQAMQFRLILTVPDQRMRAIVLRKKEELTRTLYYHGSRRRADTMDLSGRDRLIEWVEPIYQRMVKNADVQLEMRDFERVEVTFPDAAVR